MAKKAGKIIVLFVEGDTDKEFYDELIKFYRANSQTTINHDVKIINLKGVGRFERKVASKIKHEILPNWDVDNVSVFCCYDSDVFELAKKPPTNWKLVKSQLKEIGIIRFHEIIAKRMIEDWFLSDIDGLCVFLKINSVSKLTGKDGYEKIKILFKKGNKIYQKGNSSHKFIGNLNLSNIRKANSSQLKNLEDEINFKEKD